MQNILRRAAVAVLLLAMLLILAGRKGKNADGPKELKTLTIGTVDTTGTMYLWGVAGAQVINDNSDEYSTEVKVHRGFYANCRDAKWRCRHGHHYGRHHCKSWQGRQF